VDDDTFQSALSAMLEERRPTPKAANNMVSEGGAAPVAVQTPAAATKVQLKIKDGEYEIGHGAVVIAAITSCTNTSNPAVMIAAGLVAK